MIAARSVLHRQPRAAAASAARGFASAAAAQAQRIVVKVGTAVVSSGASGRLAVSRIGGLVEQIRELSAGGRGQLGMTPADTGDSPEGLINRQMCAAAGQAVLMGTYTSMMNALGLECAQVLITQNDFVCPQRYGRLTSTLEAVAMMTDVDAVFDKPPTEAGAKRIPVFGKKQQVAIGALSVGGRGGMASKIHAAQTAAAGGVHAVAANGHDLENISRVFAGGDVGTLFPGSKTRPTKLQHWLAHAAKSTNLKGQVRVSRSAAARLSRGAGDKCAAPAPGLTLADILSTHGDFSSNTAVEITDDEGAPIGRGTVQLASAELMARPRGGSSP